MNTVRSEKDSMGAIDVPADKLWGAQTQRSLEHFRISTEKMPTSLIQACCLKRKRAPFVRRRMKYWQDSMTTNSRWLSGRPAPARKVT